MFTLIKNIHLFAPEDKGITDILIGANKIIKVARNIGFDFDDLGIIDGTGKVAMPGLIDQHVHLIGGGGENGFASLIKEVEMTDCIQAGVTTVVGMLGTDSEARSVEALVAKTKGLNEQGITAYCLTGSYMYPPNTLTGSVRKDISFISDVIGVKIALADHRSSNISQDELARLATQARYAGLLGKKAGEVHIHLGKGKSGLQDVMAVVEQTDIPVTTFHPTHCGNNIEDAIKFAKMGGYVDFTTGGNPDETAATVARVMAQVPPELITISSDSNGSLPRWNVDFQIVGMGVGKMTTMLETLSQLSLHYKVDLAVALAFFTANVAKALALYPAKGNVAPGSDGDLIIVDEKLRLDMVIAKGQVMLKDGILVASNYYNYED